MGFSSHARFLYHDQIPISDSHTRTHKLFSLASLSSFFYLSRLFSFRTRSRKRRHPPNIHTRTHNHIFTIVFIVFPRRIASYQSSCHRTGHETQNWIRSRRSSIRVTRTIHVQQQQQQRIQSVPFRITMGKKSKANRKPTAKVASAAAEPVPTVATTSVYTEAVKTRSTVREDFPQSTFFIQAESFRKKGNHAKAKKIYLQGINNSCVPCMSAYGCQLLFGGEPEEKKGDRIRVMDHPHLHLVMPLFLEGAIRGSVMAIHAINVTHIQTTPEVDGFGSYHPIANYWLKCTRKKSHRERRAREKQAIEDWKQETDRLCSVCHQPDSDTVTLRKCEGCKFYYYCSTECQKSHWHAGHAGVCRHLGLLKKYHRPFAEKIQNDIIVHGIDPENIPELQELRTRLGLSRPQTDYQEMLDAVQARRIHPVELMLPHKDGMVQIGSFPRLM